MIALVAVTFEFVIVYEVEAEETGMLPVNFASLPTEPVDVPDPRNSVAVSAPPVVTFPVTLMLAVCAVGVALFSMNDPERSDHTGAPAFVCDKYFAVLVEFGAT